MNPVLYPAIDVRGDNVVRLRQGDYAQETRYAVDPLAVASGYAAQGARWLHLVDLDAARSGGYTLMALLARIKATTGVRVQTGGGVRSEGDVESILAAGADRVVVGSLAIREPGRVCGWLRRFGVEHITVAMDARMVNGAWQLPSHGWTEHSDAQLAPLLARYAEHGLRHLLCTDIDRDGMLSGPNLALYQHVLRIVPTLQLQASGGVRDAADIRTVHAAGCAGVILGKALLDGRLQLSDAMQEAMEC